MLADEKPGTFYVESGRMPDPESAPGGKGRPPLGDEERRRRWRIAAGILALILLLFVTLAITAPLSKSLQPIAAPSITLLSAEGKPIARRGAVIEEPVDVTKLPPHVFQAFIAIEDRRFYEHIGIDPWGIARAAINNATVGYVREGGSTISQQLAKLAFLSSERTAARKAQEAILALWLEIWLSKDEILSRYLSSVYFGDNVYGLRAAANHYFSRDPEDLTVGQAAMLAGLVKAPSRLAPTSNLKGARDRGKVVARAMAEAGYLSKEEADGLAPVRLKRGPVKDLPSGTYFADWVFDEAQAAAESGYGERVVRTTLEDRLQRQAARVIRNTGVGRAQVALVAMRPDGHVVAMVGGKSYKQSPFNRATQAKRQPGSTFKLFVYLAAMRNGFDPVDMIEDRPVTIGDWTPRNSDGQYRGPITLRQAFAVSSNVAAVRLSERIGRDKVIQAARDLGITSPLTEQPSLALGSSGVTLIEMVAAYASLAGNAYPVKPRGLPEATEEGWFSRWTGGTSRFDKRTRDHMLELLWAAANEGTGQAARLQTQTFGKTGTSQDNRDALFIGFAGDLVTGVWVGNDNNSPLGGIQGGGLPARIWRNFMAGAVTGSGARIDTPEPMPEPGEVPIEEVPGIIDEYDVGDALEEPIPIDGDFVPIEDGPEGPMPGEEPVRGIPIIAPPPPGPGEEPLDEEAI